MYHVLDDKTLLKPSTLPVLADAESDLYLFIQFHIHAIGGVKSAQLIVAYSPQGTVRKHRLPYPSPTRYDDAVCHARQSTAPAARNRTEHTAQQRVGCGLCSNMRAR